MASSGTGCTTVKETENGNGADCGGDVGLWWSWLKTVQVEDYGEVEGLLALKKTLEDIRAKIVKEIEDQFVRKWLRVFAGRRGSRHGVLVPVAPVTDILSRLAVKTLLRSTSVNNSWCGLTERDNGGHGSEVAEKLIWWKMRDEGIESQGSRTLNKPKSSSKSRI
ncbi:hypothetical protein RJ640_013815 [Escallonia rubra]|uniref:Uncharacterized protein n=1 Tax=Escallonia rubra TaxID=112253 RepID=A0AA88QC94_9ASTE|nr:hypothetical protein RJ640_013815 [Escallonia rubra]